MLFSVIIPTYNRLALLSEALHSVWAQTFTDYEVIVVDDGSCDGTSEWLRMQAPLVKGITQLNLGPGAARNEGAKKACGQYLAFLDSDDLWFPWTLDTFASEIERNCAPAIVSSNLALIGQSSEISSFVRGPARSDAYPDYLSSHREGCFVGAGMSVLRRDFFLLARGFDKTFRSCEDHDLILRMGTATGFVQIRSPVTLAYRKQLNSVTSRLDPTIEGCLKLIQRERSGGYPGASCRAAERQEILSLHARPLAVECVRQGLITKAWQIYMATFYWNLRLRKLKFLPGLPMLIVDQAVRAVLRILRGVERGIERSTK